jgi:hypothetical protein
MTTPDPRRGGSRPAGQRPAPDPLAMTPREKLAAEWEARHDVAAHGRRPLSESVQHHLGSGRTREPRIGVPAGRAQTDHPAPTPPHRTAPPVPPVHRRPWWRFWDRG